MDLLELIDELEDIVDKGVSHITKTNGHIFFQKIF